MQALYRQALVLTLVILCGVNYIQSVSVSNADWFAYKNNFYKQYATADAEANARYNYAYNSQWIFNHNDRADRGMSSYRLAPNQFTDMQLDTFKALFPVTEKPTISYVTPPPTLSSHFTPFAFDPRVNNAIYIKVQNQGVKFGSGWAYATAASIALLHAQRMGSRNPVPLSGEHLIDCAGCTTHFPQAAFDYLTQYNISLKLESEYPRNIESLTPLACRANSAMIGTNLYKYSAGIVDGNEGGLSFYVSAGYPVVTEFNPTSFEFMHYKSGVFTQPATSQGSHFMLVIGYDVDNWILQNSFGATWGENGFVRIKRNDINAKLPKSATFPTE